MNALKMPSSFRMLPLNPLSIFFTLLFSAFAIYMPYLAITQDAGPWVFIALAFSLMFLFAAAYFGLAYVIVKPDALTALGMWWSGPARDVKVRIPSMRTLRWSEVETATFCSVRGKNGSGMDAFLPAVDLNLRVGPDSVLLLQPYLTRDCRRLASYMHQMGVAVKINQHMLGKGFVLG
jgi:hypothetical protein